MNILEFFEKYPEFRDGSTPPCYIEGFANDYVEPGYSLEGNKEIIIFGNWNHDYKECYGISDEDWEWLEEHAEFQWLDEWTTCCECYRAIRTSPDCSVWTPSYWVGDGFILCHECVEEDPTEYLEYLSGNPDNAVTFDIDLKEHGYVRLIEDMEHGFHYGQDAHPKVVAKSLRSYGVSDFIFSIDSASQFDTSFSVWVHEDELYKVIGEHVETDLPYSVAGRLEEFLRAASLENAVRASRKASEEETEQ